MKHLLFLLLLLPQMAAADNDWTFGDWIVRTHVVDTGEDLRKTCTAHTGGDGLPILGLEVSNGDAGPPYAYPTPIYRSTAPRGFTTLIQAGDSVVFEFDDGTGSDVLVETGVSEGVFAFAEATPFPQHTLWYLQNMRALDTLSIYRFGPEATRAHVFTASLRGFTAAYLKMMEACGFAPGDVL